MTCKQKKNSYSQSLSDGVLLPGLIYDPTFELPAIEFLLKAYRIYIFNSGFPYQFRFLNNAIFLKNQTFSSNHRFIPVHFNGFITEQFNLK